MMNILGWRVIGVVIYVNARMKERRNDRQMQ